MLPDFKMIHAKFPREVLSLTLYPLADAHIGSREFDEAAFRHILKVAEEDESGAIVLAGDMISNGLKSSVTNVYEETMRPSEQKDYLYELLTPVKDKIIACVGGNHELRSVKEVDTDPMYDVMARMGRQEYYRQNAAFLKVSLGVGATNKYGRQTSYGIVVTHGSTRNKHDKFINGIDGADLFISGHTHQNEYQQHAKVKMDLRSGTVAMTPYRKLICRPFQRYGGYAVRGEFLPTGAEEYQYVRLSGEGKAISFHTIPMR